MKEKNASYRLIRLIFAAALLSLSCFAAAQVSANRIKGPVGPGKVVVSAKFGGTIFGFDIDQNGTEGVLTEGQTLNNGNTLNAVETFDQKTGKLVKVVRKTETKDEDVTLGVVGGSVGLIEHDHVKTIFVIGRSYHLMNPLSGNKYTGTWTPGLDANHIIMGVSRNQGTPMTAFFVDDNVVNNPHNLVFGSDVAHNKSGPKVKMTDPNFMIGVPPVIALDTETNTAVIAQDFGSPTSVPDIGLVDLTKGEFSHFNGLGFGSVNGIAVDSADGIACTTTEIDASVEFYDLKTQTGTIVQLPGSGGGQIFSGADVEFDPIHKLFLVAQPVSSTQQGVSSIQVYDSKGNLVESLNGFNFSNAFTVIPVHIALNPRHRSGFVDDTAGIRSFTY
jgi:hypothetical protein